ncbi:MAG: hypothetical protein SFU27_02080 [Thermonemataceae bacterium]|nr:hypothetical protein [Thermonemataceae bacterium]
MKRSMLSLIFIAFSFISFAQTDWQDLKMGSSANPWQSKAKDISNPNSLDENIFN